MLLLMINGLTFLFNIIDMCNIIVAKSSNTPRGKQVKAQLNVARPLQPIETKGAAAGRHLREGKQDYRGLDTLT